MLPVFLGIATVALAVAIANRVYARDLNLTLYVDNVTPEMTAWAQAILNSSVPYGYISPRRKFGSVELVARVEPHTWTIRNGVKTAGNFRGVTLYSVS